jgi:hypothetical protein
MNAKHRRRSPCCADEARRYLTADVDAAEHDREVVLEPARAHIAELESAVDFLRAALASRGSRDALGADPWTWLHNNDFSWDDVNAIAAVLGSAGFDIVLRPAPAGGGWDVLPVCSVCGAIQTS